jgi:hypothetical protein
MKKAKHDLKTFKNKEYGKEQYQGTSPLVCTGYTGNKPT